MRRSVFTGLFVCMALALGVRTASAQALPVFGRGTVDLFLDLHRIPGDSTDSQHRGQIDVFTFSHTTSQTGTVLVGAGAGKASVGDLVFTKGVDSASPKLFLACCKGETLARAVLSARKPTGRLRSDFLVITLRDVIISSYTITGGQDGQPMEQVSLNFGAIEYEYRVQKPDGLLGGVIKAGWDVRGGQPRAANEGEPGKDVSPVVTPK